MPLRRLAAAVPVILVIIAAGLLLPHSPSGLRELLPAAGVAAPAAALAAWIVLTPALFPGPVLAAAGGLAFGAVGGTALAWRERCWEASPRSGWRARSPVARPRGSRAAARGWRAIHALLERRGFVAVLAARMMPGVPATGLYYAAGTSPVRVRAFAPAIAIGALLRTTPYALLGQGLASGSAVSIGIAAASIAIGGAGALVLPEDSAPLSPAPRLDAKPTLTRNGWWERRVGRVAHRRQLSSESVSRLWVTVPRVEPLGQPIRAFRVQPRTCRARLSGRRPLRGGAGPGEPDRSVAWQELRRGGRGRRARSAGGSGGEEEGAPPKLRPAFYKRAVTLVASADGLDGRELPISIEAVCDVPEKLAKGAARLAGSDGVVRLLPRTTIWEDRALKIGPAATVLLDGADTVLVRGRLTRPRAWRQDEDGSRIPTFRAGRIVVTD